MHVVTKFSLRLSVAIVCVAMSGLFAQAQQQDVTARWEAIKDSGDVGLITAFRKEYPGSRYDLDALVILAALIAKTDTDQTSISGAVTFTTPLMGYGETLATSSLSQLLKGSPEFAPIEGLPEELWKDKPCTTCHAWTQETLCTQAEHYTQAENVHRLNVEHPLGRPFKEALRAWAEGGCL